MCHHQSILETGAVMTGLILLKRNQNLGKDEDLWMCKDKASSEAEVGARPDFISSEYRIWLSSFCAPRNDPFKIYSQHLNFRAILTISKDHGLEPGMSLSTLSLTLGRV